MPLAIAKLTETLKILGQSSPAATTATTLYTVPALTSTLVSMISICNTNTSTIKARVWFQIAGASDSTQQYLYYDVVIDSNQTLATDVGLRLATTDVIRIQSDTTNVAFSAFGVERI